MSNLSRPEFHDADQARIWLERELWPQGPICPHCGVIDQATALQGKAHRPGVYKCNACREQFTITVGTLYERSKIPLHKWLAATHLIVASKKGMSALQISRMLDVSYKSTWFMCMRIRESLRETSPSPLGGEGKVVEADETYIGGKDKNRHANKRLHVPGPSQKEPVVALVERDGRVRSFHVRDVNSKNLRPILTEQLDQSTRLMTDTTWVYKNAGKHFAGHEMVNHGAGEYVRGFAHTNTVEGYFSLLKRGIMGTFHHVSSQHLKRYVGEFDFRYNTRKALGYTDADRFTQAIGGIVGKRLTYRRVGGRTEATA